MASDFWARKLAPAVAPVAPARPVGPPGYQLPSQARQAAPQAPVQPRQQQIPSTEGMTTSQALATYVDGNAPHHRVEGRNSNCPNCGRPNYFSRANAGVAGMAPAPHCYECGYNGRYEQGLPPA